MKDKIILKGKPFMLTGSWAGRKEEIPLLSIRRQSLLNSAFRRKFYPKAHTIFYQLVNEKGVHYLLIRTAEYPGWLRARSTAINKSTGCNFHLTAGALVKHLGNSGSVVRYITEEVKTDVSDVRAFKLIHYVDDTVTSSYSKKFKSLK